MLDAMTPQEFDELVALNEIEPIGVTPFHRLLVFVATCLANQFRSEDDESVSMEALAEFAGLPKEKFKSQEAEKFVSPEVASSMFRR